MEYTPDPAARTRLLDRRERPVEPIRCGGVPLGMFCTTSYAPARFTLSPGESLVVYTDGLSEAKNARSEPFGEGGLLRAPTISPSSWPGGRTSERTPPGVADRKRPRRTWRGPS